MGKDNVGELLLLAIMVVPGPQPCHRLIDVMEVYTLDEHGVFVEAAMYIILRLKEDFGVIWKCKEVRSRPYLRRVNQGVQFTRSIHLIRTVKAIVCGYTVSQGPVESRQKKSDQAVIVYSVSLVVIKFKND